MTPCPQCGEPTEPGQLVCVNCGARIALRRRGRYTGPPASALPVIAILLAVVVIGAGAFGFALSELTSDDDGEVSAADREPPPPAASSGEPQTTTQREEPPAETETETAPEQPRRSLLLQWPADLTAHTVVLVTSSDRPAARRVAAEAARAGLEAGLLRSDNYDLGTGLWIVFAGRFDTREAAVRQASNLAERYPGAYAQLIRPSR